MIDLNQVEIVPEKFDLAEIRARLEASAASWVPQLFPNGRLSSDKKMWRLADFSGRAPTGDGSCIIHIRGPRAGHGCDFSTDERAGPIDLVGYARGLAGLALFKAAADLASVAAKTPARAAVKADEKDRRRALEVERILKGCVPLAGTLGEHYLSVRGLVDPRSPDLMFHPDLTDVETRRGYCGLVAMIRDREGAAIGGIHRTFLLDDGSGKAEPGKKMLGPIAGGSVRLAAIGANGHLGIAEGIETALSAMAIFSIPTWAAMNDGGVAKFEWPAGVKSLTIFADAGAAGEKAAGALEVRAIAAGLAARVVRPLHGDDFNDDLQHQPDIMDYDFQVIDTPAAVTVQRGYATLGELQAAIETLTREDDRVPGMLTAACALNLDPFPLDQLLQSIKRRSGANLTALRNQAKTITRRLGAGGDLEGGARPAWQSQLRRDAFGQFERNEANMITAIANDEAFAGVIIFDQFRMETMVVKPLPWDTIHDEYPRPWRDVDDVLCAEWLQRRELNVTPGLIARSIHALSRRQTVHPVREYLQSLAWDGMPRLQTWTLDYLGAADTPLHRAFGAMWMISAVARIMKPGTKADAMIILEGPQGASKSSALKALTGEAWFTDDLADVGSKDAAQQLRGVWIIEISELDAIGRVEVGKIKAFLSRTVDRYRPAYGRYVIEVARQCIFAGSVNKEAYLRDDTGARRMWPIRCGKIDLGAIKVDRDQLWAEAVVRFQAGAIWWLDDPELIALAGREQDSRFESDAWDERIERWLRTKDGFARMAPLNDVSVSEILLEAIGLEVGRWSRSDQMRVSAYLKRHGWERFRATAEPRPWRYRKD